MARIVVAHRGEGVGEAPLQGWVEIGPRREHAVIVGVGRPDLDQGTFGHQALVAQSLPERTAYRAGIGATGTVAESSGFAMKRPGTVYSWPLRTEK